MGVTANKVLDVARSWLGYSETNKRYLEIMNVYNEHRPLARGYAIKPTDDWCDCFVSAVAIKAGAVDIIGTEVGCQKHIDIFKQKGIWIEDGKIKPQPGDIIVFNWDDATQPNDGFADHIGYVEQVYGDTIICIEGNKGEAVSRRTINIGWGYIRGFARPKYDKEQVKPIKQNKTIAEVANEVIAGAWGVGIERKNALKAAGYNADLVQEKVNDILSKKSVRKTTTQIAKEIIAGKWGNGASRKKSVIAAGYDYDEVQAIVNRLLK